jgi:indoleamine 2,3-dioxygenase
MSQVGSDPKAAESATPARGPFINSRLRSRGFLPEHDPLIGFPSNSEFAGLDEVGRDLPSLLQDPGFRVYARSLDIPLWPENRVAASDLPELRLYYLRVGFLASAYINQVGEEPSGVLPANLARPLCRACKLLNRPPILSYDGYALYNWKRFHKDGPIALGNIDTVQNFVHLFDEHWFILVHVEIEAIAARILDSIAIVQEALDGNAPGRIDDAVRDIAVAINEEVRVLRRIPEKMDPALYYKTFRPYIRFFENVEYEADVEGASVAAGSAARLRISFRGETGAQSSVMPLLVAFMKIPHRTSSLTAHLIDMRNYMPAEHRTLIAAVEAMPSIRAMASKQNYNAILDAMAEFRSVHYGWAQEYINRWTDDPRGTGGTPYMQWLKQLIDETLAFKID